MKRIANKTYNSQGEILSKAGKNILYYLFYKFINEADCDNVFVFNNELYQIISLEKLMKSISLSKDSVLSEIEKLISCNFLFKKIDDSDNLYLSINLDEYKIVINEDDELGKSILHFINGIQNNKESFIPICEKIN